VTIERGKLIVIAAPSGAGKTTLVRKLMLANPDLQFSVSYTTRQKRYTEKNGADYFFIDVPEFERMVAADEFLEHALVFDNHYGTSRDQVETQLAHGNSVILEIDWQGAQQVRSNMPDCERVFILPPSVIELRRRLTSRGTDSEEIIDRRFRDALSDLSHWDEFDYAVINEDLDQASNDLQSIIDGTGQQHSVAAPQVRRAVGAIMAGPAQ
jgi:guanylate kinase